MNLIYLSKSQLQALKGCALFMMVLSCTNFFLIFVLFLYIISIFVFETNKSESSEKSYLNRK